MDFFTLLGQFGIAGIIVLASVWLIKELAKLILSRDLEKFKSDLEIEAFQFKIRFEKLHGERAEVLKNLYQKIIIAERNIASIIHPIQFPEELSQKEKIDETIKSFNDLSSYYQENKIFLDEHTEKDVDKIIQICRTAWYKYEEVKWMKDNMEGGYIKKWGELWKKFEKESPRAKKRITMKFREILGIGKLQT